MPQYQYYMDIDGTIRRFLRGSAVVQFWHTYYKQWRSSCYTPDGIVKFTRSVLIDIKTVSDKTGVMEVLL